MKGRKQRRPGLPLWPRVTAAVPSEMQGAARTSAGLKQIGTRRWSATARAPDTRRHTGYGNDLLSWRNPPFGCSSHARRGRNTVHHVTSSTRRKNLETAAPDHNTLRARYPRRERLRHAQVKSELDVGAIARTNPRVKGLFSCLGHSWPHGTFNYGWHTTSGVAMRRRVFECDGESSRSAERCSVLLWLVCPLSHQLRVAHHHAHHDHPRDLALDGDLVPLGHRCGLVRVCLGEVTVHGLHLVLRAGS